MNIKKQYQEIHALLENNKTRKVSTIMPQLLELMERKSAGGADGKTFILNDEGQVTHIFCYYHKKWESVELCEYGTKTNSTTGLNTMCKEGVKAWNAQQKEIKSLDQVLLQEVVEGKLEPTKIADEKVARIASIKSTITPREDGIGDDTI